MGRLRAGRFRVERLDLGAVSGDVRRIDVYAWRVGETQVCMHDGAYTVCGEGLLSHVGLLWGGSDPGVYCLAIGVPEGGAEVLVETSFDKIISVLPQQGLALAEWPRDLGAHFSIVVVNGEGERFFIEEVAHLNLD